MYLDVFTLSALVDEFMDVLVGGRVQDSLSVDETGLGLEIYAHHQRRYLYLSADPQTPRIHLVPEKLRRGLQKPTQLGLLFRRYVEGGVITHVSQPDWERILHIDVQGQEGDVTIIVEPMERRSNLLLVQNGIILDCMRRVGADENRYRVSLPAHEYVPPPPQTGKLNPFALTLESLIGLFAQNQRPEAQDASGADRAAARHQSAAGERDRLPRERNDRAESRRCRSRQRCWRRCKTVIAPLQRREWQPGVAENERGVEAYSVYPLESIDGWHAVESVSEAMTLLLLRAGRRGCLQRRQSPGARGDPRGGGQSAGTAGIAAALDDRRERARDAAPERRTDPRLPVCHPAGADRTARAVRSRRAGTGDRARPGADAAGKCAALF